MIAASSELLDWSSRKTVPLLTDYTAEATIDHGNENRLAPRGSVWVYPPQTDFDKGGPSQELNRLMAWFWRLRNTSMRLARYTAVDSVEELLPQKSDSRRRETEYVMYAINAIGL